MSSRAFGGHTCHKIFLPKCPKRQFWCLRTENQGGGVLFVDFNVPLKVQTTQSVGSSFDGWMGYDPLLDVGRDGRCGRAGGNEWTGRRRATPADLTRDQQILWDAWQLLYGRASITSFHLHLARAPMAFASRSWHCLPVAAMTSRHWMIPTRTRGSPTLDPLTALACVIVLYAVSSDARYVGLDEHWPTSIIRQRRVPGQPRVDWSHFDADRDCVECFFGWSSAPSGSSVVLSAWSGPSWSRAIRSVWLCFPPPLPGPCPLLSPRFLAYCSWISTSP
jgi:hypothetical protein